MWHQITTAESPIRREIVKELKLEHGKIPLPSKQGLGVELNGVAVEKYKAG